MLTNEDVITDPTYDAIVEHTALKRIISGLPKQSRANIQVVRNPVVAPLRDDRYLGDIAVSKVFNQSLVINRDTESISTRLDQLNRIVTGRASHK